VRDGAPYTAIAFAVVARHRRQIEYNHGMTLEEIGAAGGLDWYELWCGFNRLPLFPATPIQPAVACAWILAAVTAG
jgi:hypothetical protein